MAAPIELNSIDIGNLDKVIVTSNSKGRGYGRRFTIQIENSSKAEVVFHELVTKARELAKAADGMEEMSIVHQFIHQLSEVEQKAIQEYKEQSLLYQFRSFFHRAFGKAPLMGSHAKRLESLEKKLGRRAQKSFGSDFISRYQDFQLAIPKEGINVSVNEKIFKVKWSESDSSELSIQEEGPNHSAVLVKIDEHDKAIFTNLKAISGCAGSLFYEITEGVSAEVRRIAEEKAAVERAAVERAEVEKAAVAAAEKAAKDQEKFSKTIAFLENLTADKKILSVDGIEARQEGDCLYIQNSADRLIIALDPPHSIQFNGCQSETMSEAARLMFNVIVSQGYKNSSVYPGVSTGRTYIKVVREGISWIPEWHLEQFFLRNPEKNAMRINFGKVEPDGSFVKEKGIDSGGPSREYIANLSSAISNLESLFQEIDGPLKIPRIIRPERDSNFSCSEEETTVYQNFGRLSAYCYQSIDDEFSFPKKVSVRTGSLFIEAVYAAAMSLSKEELTKPIKNQIEAQARMAKAILTDLDTHKADYIKQAVAIFDWYLDENALMNCLDELTKNPTPVPGSDQALLHAALFRAASFIDADQYMNDLFELDIEKIKSNQGQFKQDLLDVCRDQLKDPKLVDELKGVSLESMMDPIFQIAVGMSRQLPEWDTIRMRSATEISTKIQGSIDRTKIIAAIYSTKNNEIFSKKVEWLKKWIREEATDSDLKAFLQFATGATALMEGGRIDIYVQDPSKKLPLTPYIISSSCTMVLKISNADSYDEWGAEHLDNTEKTFIANLKGAMQQEGFQLK